MSLLEWLYADDPGWFRFFTTDEWEAMVNADLYLSYVRTLDDIVDVPWRHGGFDLTERPPVLPSLIGFVQPVNQQPQPRSEVNATKNDPYAVRNDPYATPQHVHVEAGVEHGAMVAKPDILKEEVADAKKVEGYFRFFSGSKMVVIDTVANTYGANPTDLHESTYGLFFTDDSGGKNFVPWSSIESIQEDEDAQDDSE